MIYRITTHDGRTLRTTTRDLRAATWTAIADRDPREITTEAAVYGRRGTYTPDRLIINVIPDTGDWDGYETDALRVRNEHGRVEMVSFSAVRIWSEDGRGQLCVGGYEADGVEDDRGIPVSVSEILDAAGFAVSEEPDVDYTSLAEEFVAANPDARYYVDDERGFANEWTLTVRMGAQQDDDDEDDDLREITVEEAVHYIADAVMEPRDYEAIHGCEPYVTAVVEA